MKTLRNTEAVMQTYTLFFISNTFISNAWLKLAKNQAKAKQHPEVELLIFENYLLSSPRLPSQNNWRYPKKCIKTKFVCFNEVIWLMTMKMGLKKNRSHKYDINRPRPRHWHEYTKYKMCLNLMMNICIKQHLTNIWNSIQEKIKQHWGWVGKKGCLWKKAACICRNICRKICM